MSKLLFDFFPIILFFIAFKFYGIFVATTTAIVATILQIGYMWLKNKKIEIMYIITLAIICVFGGATLILHNELFIKWKPSILYWSFAIAFLFSHFFTDKTILQRLLEENIPLSKAAFNRLSYSWVGFFTLMGFANLWVIYHFSTNAWVNFKLFGTLGLTIVFGLLQGIYIHHQQERENHHEQS